MASIDAPSIEARFDDLGSVPSRSLRFEDPVAVLEARRPDEVPGALAAVEAEVAGGLWAAGFLAYEAAPALDPALSDRAREPEDPFRQMPLLWFATFRKVRRTSVEEGGDGGQGEPPLRWRPSIPRERFDERIGRIREHIADGDTYQINYTLRLRTELERDDRAFYHDLLLAQRGSYAAYLNLGRYRILSASPELFFRIEGDRITTRPMKGTAPRGRWPAEDEEAARRLRASTKDRAENAMIVDLLRSDLGRISRPGSVTVPAMFEAERYETVWQLTSTVTSQLVAGTGIVDVFRALFPSGSVTGAPKIRSMQIIRDLEDSPRGVYTGAIGYLSPPQARQGEGEGEPRANFNVAIRTVALDTESGIAEYGVGGGVTFDSTARGEYDEVLAKARILTARPPPFGLIETLRYDPGEGFRRLEGHLGRLRASAEYFGFELDEPALGEALEKGVADAEGSRRVRLVLWRNGETEIATASITASANTVRLAIDDRPVDPADPLLFHKTTYRARYEEAASRHPEADDVVFVNPDGEVTETTTTNLAVRLDGVWWTPPLGSGLLPGVERAALLASGELAERPITVEQLRRAQALEVLNSVRGRQPAVVLAPAT